MSGALSMAWRRGASWLAVAALVAGASAAQAQKTGIGLPGNNPDKPFTIEADGGIEWQQHAQAYIARDNVRAVQGDVTIHADEMIAYYRTAGKAGSEVWRIKSNGNVRIVTPAQTAYGDKAVYDVDDGVMVLTGRNVRLETATDKILARRSLEFWEKRNLAVARGDAVAVRGENRMRADILTAHFIESPDGASRIERINAFDNVLISSADEIVRADRGVYNLETGIVVLAGSVKITRGDSQLNGAFAEVNLDTGVSRIFAGDAKGVRGYFKSGDAAIVPRRRRRNTEE